MTLTASEIAQRLAGRAEELARYLLPGGKKTGGEWECGSVSGGEGKSLKVRLSGDKVGLWCDFATGTEKGDLIDLWKIARNLSIGQAIREAKEWLGIREPAFEPAKKQYSRPKKNGIEKLTEESPVFAYLKNERGLTADAIKAFKVSEKGGAMVFPFLSPEGEALNIKYIDVQRDEKGKKVIRSEPNCPPCLFGWQAIDEGRTVTICEGEIDAITLHQFGLPALSVPFGAGKGSKNDWIDYEWENLSRFDTIYLCYDQDEAGQSCIMEVAERLGKHRCRIVSLPHKDPNECLTKGTPPDQIATCWLKAKSISPPEICDPAHFHQAVVEYFHPPGGKPLGLFPILFAGKIGFRPGEVTIWTGISGHGKSLLLGEVMLFAAIEGERVAIASMEMKPHQTLGRMLRQTTVKETPTVDEIAGCLDWMRGKVWVYDVMGNIAPSKLLELMQYSRCRHAVTHFVIDSLMKCNIGSDDYNAQREFMNSVSSFAKTHNCHVHLVAHARKGKDETAVVGKMEIKGSSDIFNQADNCLTVWRNKAKEEQKSSDDTDPDAVVFCDKQRESGWEGKVRLHYFGYCTQFVDEHNTGENRAPRPYNIYKKTTVLVT